MCSNTTISMKILIRFAFVNGLLFSLFQTRVFIFMIKPFVMAQRVYRKKSIGGHLRMTPITKRLLLAGYCLWLKRNWSFSALICRISFDKTVVICVRIQLVNYRCLNSMSVYNLIKRLNFCLKIISFHEPWLRCARTFSSIILMILFYIERARIVGLQSLSVSLVSKMHDFSLVVCL